jgi:hypothetical protein
MTVFIAGVIMGFASCVEEEIKGGGSGVRDLHIREPMHTGMRSFVLIIAGRAQLNHLAPQS